ncbi:hypothetical protein VOLCADRAFT_43107, partial [Volvox carteri f. nagariensis]
GWVMLQNLPSVVAALALCPPPGSRVLDMCAAPGGKTTLLAQIMGNLGEIVALDRSHAKVSEIRSLTGEMGATCVEDGEGSPRPAPSFPPEYFDHILLDAPCSALGLRPRLQQQSSAAYLRQCGAAQRRLGDAAVRLLRTGGSLVYSTCTINP